MSQELWSFNQSAEIEKSRLSELVRMLTGKLSTAEEAGTQSEMKLREEIQRCAREYLDRSHLFLQVGIVGGACSGE